MSHDSGRKPGPQALRRGRNVLLDPVRGRQRPLQIEVHDRAREKPTAGSPGLQHGRGQAQRLEVVQSERECCP